MNGLIHTNGRTDARFSGPRASGAGMSDGTNVQRRREYKLLSPDKHPQMRAGAFCPSWWSDDFVQALNEAALAGWEIEMSNDAGQILLARTLPGPHPNPAPADTQQGEVDEALLRSWKSSYENACTHRDEARRERDEAQTELARVQKDWERLQAERDDARRERGEARRERGEARRERDHAKAQRDAWQKERDELFERAKELTDELGKLRDNEHATHREWAHATQCNSAAECRETMDAMNRNLANWMDATGFQTAVMYLKHQESQKSEYAGLVDQLAQLMDAKKTTGGEG